MVALYTPGAEERWAIASGLVTRAMAALDWPIFTTRLTVDAGGDVTVIVNPKSWTFDDARKMLTLGHLHMRDALRDQRLLGAPPGPAARAEGAGPSAGPGPFLTLGAWIMLVAPDLPHRLRAGHRSGIDGLLEPVKPRERPGRGKTPEGSALTGGTGKAKGKPLPAAKGKRSKAKARR
jgi:hypothetical protein